jgi:hypothetical protein
VQNLQFLLQDFPFLHRLEQPVEHLLASAWSGIIRVQRIAPAENQPRVIRRRPTDVWDFVGESFFAWIGLCVALLILAGVVYRLRSWWREDAGRAVDSNELLTQFRELHREGDLTEEEFRSIKSRLAAPAPPESPSVQEGDGSSD